MYKLLLLTTILFYGFDLTAQQNPIKYVQAIKQYRQQYISAHEVVLKDEKKYFRFYYPDASYKIPARFTKLSDTNTVRIKTTGKLIPEKYFTRYGKLTFSYKGTSHQLTVFQSKNILNKQDYETYLFLPFSDATSGTETYGSGRYIDLQISDLDQRIFLLDFNKAYNPYCAYSEGYNCPVPPKENRLTIPIKAGEKIFGKPIKH